MTWLRVIASRVRAVLSQQRQDRDFDDELREHLELLIEEFEASGMRPAEARRAAVLKLGQPQQLREANRDYRGLPFLETFTLDFRFALRTLRKDRAFTAVAVVTMALGIGLSSYLFSFLNGFILRPLPGARHPEQLVALQAPVSYPYFESYCGSRVALSMAALIGPTPFSVAVEGAAAAAPERISGQMVSPEYFATLGVSPALGRFFAATADVPGAATTVVVSERFWRLRLNSDPHAAGRTLRVNGRRATILGVAQKDFLGVFPATASDIFIPITADPSIAPELAGDVLHNPAAAGFQVVLRLAPNVTKAAAEAALDAETRQLDEQNGKPNPTRDQQAHVLRLVQAGGVMPATPELISGITAGWGLIIALILSFTCANLAGLILARGNARSREIAIRLSVGASRPRLIRQLLMESVILAMLGGAAGLGGAYLILSRPIPGLRVSTDFPGALNVTPDWRVALITFFIATMSGIGFGLMPALATTRPDLVTGLKEIAPAHAGRYRRLGLRNLFMVYQMAAAMLLVLMMGFAVVGIEQGWSRNGPGFDTAGVYLFSVDPARNGYSPAEAAVLLAGLPDRLAHVRGVENVTLAQGNAFNFLAQSNTASVQPGDPGARTLHRVSLQKIGPGFFSALGLRVLRGREFASRDVRPAAETGTIQPVVINQAAAQQLFGGADALGRLIRQDEKVFQVTGIAQYERPAVFQKDPIPVLFLPFTLDDLEHGWPIIAVRVRRGVGFTPVRSELKAIDGRLMIFNLETMEENLDGFNQALGFVTAMYGSVGMFALVLACVGLAGVTAQAVVRRRKEIGIRMALGARRPQVLRLVMKESAAMVVAGSLLGIAGAAALVRILIWATASFGALNTSALAPAQVIGAPMLLIAVAGLACYLPARRSATIDPLTALREE